MPIFILLCDNNNDEVCDFSKYLGNKKNIIEFLTHIYYNCLYDNIKIRVFK
jgi:hypothetical protein